MTANSRVPENLIQKYWDTKLTRKTESEDIFSNYKGEIKGDGNLPNAIIAVTKQSGKTTGSIPLLKSLKGAGQTGRTGLSGNEEFLEILEYTVYANEFKHGVNIDSFGIDAVANSPYKLLEMGGPLLMEYMEKFRGTHRREALCQRFSSNTTVAPSSTVQHINANVYVAGVSAQPTYSDTLSAYSTSINASVPVVATASNQMTPAVLKALEEDVRLNKKITPLDDGYWVLTIPANQKKIIMDEDTGLLKTFLSSSAPERALKGWVASYGRFHLVTDDRSPTLLATPGGSALTWTYTSVDDSRPSAGADIYDVGFVLGKAAIVELELEKLHFKKDLTVEYGRENRLGAFSNYGDQIVEWADGTDVRINQGSCVVLYASEV